MAFELIYTSAPKGIKPNTSGFCVVACTQGLNPRIMLSLEALSAYKPLYAHYEANAWENPVSQAHYILEINNQKFHILSRVCFNGVDYTKRSNKLASHLVLNSQDMQFAQRGPASVLQQEHLFKDANWEIKSEYYQCEIQLPLLANESTVKCDTWQEILGDKGWAGFLAESYLKKTNQIVYLLYSPTQQNKILNLVNEAISLLPVTEKWNITFNTYFTNLPAGVNCAWRCCPINTEAAILAQRSSANLIIDLTQPKQCTIVSDLITIARTGIISAPKTEIPSDEEDIITYHPQAPKNTQIIIPEIKHKTPINNDMPLRLPKEDKPLATNITWEYTAKSSWQKKLFLFIALLVITFGIIGVFLYQKADKDAQRYESCTQIITNFTNKLEDYEYNYQNLPDDIHPHFDYDKAIDNCEEKIKKIEELKENLNNNLSLHLNDLPDNYKSNIDNKREKFIKKCDKLKTSFKTQIKTLKTLKQKAKEKTQKKLEVEKKEEDLPPIITPELTEPSINPSSEPKKQDSQPTLEPTTEKQIETFEFKKEFAWLLGPKIYNLKNQEVLKIQMSKKLLAITFKLNKTTEKTIKEGEESSTIEVIRPDANKISLALSLKDGILTIKKQNEQIIPENYQIAIKLINNQNHYQDYINLNWTDAYSQLKPETNTNIEIQNERDEIFKIAINNLVLPKSDITKKIKIDTENLEIHTEGITQGKHNLTFVITKLSELKKYKNMDTKTMENIIAELKENDKKTLKENYKKYKEAKKKLEDKLGDSIINIQKGNIDKRVKEKKAETEHNAYLRAFEDIKNKIINTIPVNKYADNYKDNFYNVPLSVLLDINKLKQRIKNIIPGTKIVNKNKTEHTFLELKLINIKEQ